MIGHSDKFLQFGELLLVDGQNNFPNEIDIGKADINGFSVDVSIDDPDGGTSFVVSLEGKTAGGDYSEIAATPAITDFSRPANLPIPRDTPYTVFRAKLKSVIGSFTKGKVFAQLDTYVGK